MDDGRVKGAVMLAKQVFIDPQTEWMIFARSFDAALGSGLTLFDVFVFHVMARQLRLPPSLPVG